MMAARALLSFCTLLLALGAPAAMPPVDDERAERMQADAVKVAAAKAEFRRRIANKWPGYEQDDRLNFPVASNAGQTQPDH